MKQQSNIDDETPSWPLSVLAIAVLCLIGEELCLRIDHELWNGVDV